MYGYISNNFKLEIEQFLISKNIVITYKLTNSIKKKDVKIITEKIQKEKIITLIVDASCFSQENIGIELLYELRIACKDIRIIFISFSKRQLTDVALLGIYDIILYNKHTNLLEELDIIFLNKKTLSEIKEFLNIKVIVDKNKKVVFNNIIVSKSYEHHVGATSFWLAYCNLYASNKKICFVELNGYGSGLKEYFIGEDYATINSIQEDKFQINNFNIIFGSKCLIDEDMILRLLLELSQTYEEIIIDINKENEELLVIVENYMTKIYTFDKLVQFALTKEKMDIKLSLQKNSKFIQEIKLPSYSSEKDLEQITKNYTEEVYKVFSTANNSTSKPNKHKIKRIKKLGELLIKLSE